MKCDSVLERGAEGSEESSFTDGWTKRLEDRSCTDQARAWMHFIFCQVFLESGQNLVLSRLMKLLAAS